MIPITLNGLLPLKFILDTGVRYPILTDRAVADFLNIKYSRTIELVGAAGGRGINALVANDIAFRLPGAEGKNQSMLVLEKDYLLLSNNLGVDVHGIIGYDVFSRFIVEIDYARQTITLHEPQGFRPKRRFKAIPITIENSKPYLQTKVVQADGSEVIAKLMMDTGASHSLLLHLQSHKNLALPEKNLRSTLGRGLGGDIYGNMARIKSLGFNEFLFEEVITSFPDKETYIDIIAETSRQGTMGGGIFSRFHIIFDYFNGKIYLRKNHEYKKKFEYDMSGMSVITLGSSLNTFIVSEVRENSPGGRVDIRKGDIIISMNGFNSQSLSLNSINSLIRSKPRKKIRLRILRDNKILKKKFRLERLL